MSVSLIQIHGILMILAWIVFGSTGILFVRYGRSLRLGNRRQLLGKAVWFQLHRFNLSISSLLTLLGFFVILVAAGGQWVDPNVLGVRLFVHSIIGGIIICCTIVQIWLALYRCHPHSPFRFMFDWIHRIVGLSTFILSIPNIFIMATSMSKSRPNLVPIFSCWTGWIVVVVIIFEKIQYQQKATARAVTNQENTNGNQRPDIELGINTNVGSRRQNQMKLLLFLIHIIISITLAISFIVFLCQ